MSFSPPADADALASFIAPRPPAAPGLGVAGRIRVRLTAFPEEAHLTATALAQAADLSPEAWQRVLRGERGLTGDEVVALAYALQVRPEWLLTGEDSFPVRVLSSHGHRLPPGVSPHPLS